MVKDNSSIAIRIEKLKLECAELEKELLGEDPDEIVKRHIKLLHSYNERKDAAQIIIGKLAALENCTVKEISEKLGLEDDD